ncbi:hypothetical protein BB561_001221 [Smittium simulii]|uniref:Coilin tudor domain-containing protein n=1 Tax=Smittium simulii TaxID=133385 RepID=A0A2T9YVK4_9FUNG|nr:hypothetical protein BB561_001221 [Smittium simulii]
MRVKLKFEEPFPKQEVWYVIPDSVRTKSTSDKKSKTPRPISSKTSGIKKIYTVKKFKKRLIKDFKLNKADKESLVLKLDGLELFENCKINSIIKEDETLAISKGKSKMKKASSKDNNSQKNKVDNVKSFKGNQEINVPRESPIAEKISKTTKRNIRKRKTNNLHRGGNTKKIKLVDESVIDESLIIHNNKYNDIDFKNDLCKVSEKINDTSIKKAKADKVSKSIKEKKNLENSRVVSDEITVVRIKGISKKSSKIESSDNTKESKSHSQQNIDSVKAKPHKNYLEQEISTEIGKLEKKLAEPNVIPEGYIITKVEHMDDYQPGWQSHRKHKKHSAQKKFLAEIEYEEYFSQNNKSENDETKSYNVSTFFESNSTDQPEYSYDHQDFNSQMHTLESNNYNVDDAYENVPSDAQKNNSIVNIDISDHYFDTKTFCIDKITPSTKNIGHTIVQIDQKESKTSENKMLSKLVSLFGINDNQISIYSQMSILPVVDQVIAFKLIEMTEDFNAAVSEFYVGQVISTDFNENKITLTLYKTPKYNLLATDNKVDQTCNQNLVLDYNMDLENIKFDKIQTKDDDAELIDFADFFSKAQVESYFIDSLLDSRLLF